MIEEPTAEPQETHVDAPSSVEVHMGNVIHRDTGEVVASAYNPDLTDVLALDDDTLVELAVWVDAESRRAGAAAARISDAVALRMKQRGDACSLIVGRNARIVRKKGAPTYAYHEDILWAVLQQLKGEKPAIAETIDKAAHEEHRKVFNKTYLNQLAKLGGEVERAILAETITTPGTWGRPAIEHIGKPPGEKLLDILF